MSCVSTAAATSICPSVQTAVAMFGPRQFSAAVFTVSMLLLSGCSKQAPSEREASPSLQREEVTAAARREVSPDEPEAALTSPDSPVDDEPLFRVPDPIRPGSDASAFRTATDEQAPAETRLPDDRPDVNELRLTASGIRAVRSRRLILLTDLPPGDVDRIPGIADELFLALQKHFGPLPPAADGSEFQVTGCCMADSDAFLSAGLMADGRPEFEHGRHLNYRFWMRDQTDDYYRRHLALHEFVHCWMTCVSGMNDIPPLWYIEGMAEYFATHQVDSDSAGGPEFGLLPTSFEGFEGWGRVSEIQRSFQSRVSPKPIPARLPTIRQVCSDATVQEGGLADYPIAWAACWFLFKHPEHSSRFSPLSGAVRRDEFRRAWRTAISEVPDGFNASWQLFIEDIDTGFTGRSLAVARQDHDTKGTLTVRADAGWQDTGLQVRAGDEIRVTAEGRATLGSSLRDENGATVQVPWISEPQGITIRYHRGAPIGTLIGWIGGDTSECTGRFAVARESAIQAPTNGRLWLQINAPPSSREHCSGEYESTFRLLSR